MDADPPTYRGFLERGGRKRLPIRLASGTSDTTRRSSVLLSRAL